VISSVQFSAEGRDNGDMQDASRTKDETRTIPAAKKETAKVMNKPLTVLIVEDTLELAEVIQATLEAMDLKVVHAAHGNRALEKFNELGPDLVLLDISLPDMTGWKIMDTIKERFENDPANMPIIIIITAYDDPANRLVGKLQGVHSYLIKPFSSDEIERTVSQAISSVTR
jgi:CheY-like chemotaxis protein